MNLRRTALSAAIALCATLGAIPSAAAARVPARTPTAPEISILTPAADQHFALGQDVSPSYGCSDSDHDSHMVSCIAPDKLDTSSPGCHELTVTAAAWDGVYSKTAHYVIDNADGSVAPGCPTGGATVTNAPTNLLTKGSAEGIDFDFGCWKGSRHSCLILRGHLSTLKADTVVEISCTGGKAKGCPPRLRGATAVRLVAKRSGSLSLARVLKGNRLRNGAKLRITLTAPGERYRRIEASILEPRFIMRFRYFYEMPDGTELSDPSNTRG
jgi:hypothetical protein